MYLLSYLCKIELENGISHLISTLSVNWNGAFSTLGINWNGTFQPKKFSRTRDISNFPTQGWADTAFYTSNWERTNIHPPKTFHCHTTDVKVFCNDIYRSNLRDFWMNEIVFQWVRTLQYRIHVLFKRVLALRGTADGGIRCVQETRWTGGWWMLEPPLHREKAGGQPVHRLLSSAVSGYTCNISI